ncbi:hypothetical protein PMAC_001883 [Pneumocystis sp. 'macacae']|nr:hypothetical protein PMAC_001883 [Pneumocystis sp. 'macacae']
MSGQELVRGKDKVVCTKQRVSVCTKSNEERRCAVEIGWEEGVHQVMTRRRQGVQYEERVEEKGKEQSKKLFSCKANVNKNKVGSKRGSTPCVHEAPRWAQVGEVGCEKNVYGANESVHQAVSGRRGGEVGVQVRVHRADKDEQEMEVEMESRSNKIEEVEVEVEIGSRLALRVEWAGVSGGGDKVKNKTRTTRDKKQRRIKNNVFFVNKEQVTSRRARVAKNQVGVDEEVYEREGVHQVARYEVCAQSSEVGVYQRDEVVCTKQRGVGEGVQEDEQEMEVEMESRSNKIEEVEVEVEIRFRLALRGVGEGYIRGGEVDGVHQVSEMSVCTRVGRRGAPGVVVEEGGRG